MAKNKFTLKDVELLSLEDFSIQIRKYSENEYFALALNLFKLIKDIITEKYRFMSWDDIEEEYYLDKDLLRRFKLIKAVINQKRICKNNSCPVFPPLIRIGKRLDNIKATNLKDAKEVFKNIESPKYKSFVEKTYEPLLMTLTKTFGQVYQIYSLSLTERFENELYFDRGIDFLDKTMEAKEKYNVDVPMPNLVEERFKVAAAGPGVTPEQIKRQMKNQQRLEEAKRKAMVEKMAKEFAETGNLSEETKKKFMSLTERGK